MPSPSLPDLPVSVLHRAIVDGSRDHFDALYDHYYDRVRYSALRAALKARYRLDLEELVQDVWFRLLDHDRRILRRFDPDRGSFRRFIGFIAYQQALVSLDYLRPRIERVGLDPDDEALVDDQTSRFVSALVQNDLFHKILDEAEAELRDDERVLLREILYGERTSRDLAQELGLSDNAIYKRHERLRKKLRSVADRLLSSPPDSSNRAGSRNAMLGVLLLGLMLRDTDRGSTARVARSPVPQGDLARTA